VGRRRTGWTRDCRRCFAWNAQRRLAQGRGPPARGPRNYWRGPRTISLRGAAAPCRATDGSPARWTGWRIEPGQARSDQHPRPPLRRAGVGAAQPLAGAGQPAGRFIRFLGPGHPTTPDASRRRRPGGGRAEATKPADQGGRHGQDHRGRDGLRHTGLPRAGGLRAAGSGPDSRSHPGLGRSFIGCGGADGVPPQGVLQDLNLPEEPHRVQGSIWTPVRSQTRGHWQRGLNRRGSGPLKARSELHPTGERGPQARWARQDRRETLRAKKNA
jgi:hypothetical protein